MAFCDPQTLDQNSRCFICVPIGFKGVLNVSLLNQISGLNATAQTLLTNSGGPNGFDKFNGAVGLAAEVYFLQQIAGLGNQTSSQLSQAAACFVCGRDGDLDDMINFLYASIAGGSTVPSTLLTGIGPYQRVFGMEWRVLVYLTCQWALMNGAVSTCNPSTLLNNAKCLLDCLPFYVLKGVKVYLLCYIFSNGLSMPNLIPAGSTYGPGSGAGPEFDLTVLPNTCYRVCWGSNEVTMKLPVSSQTFASTGPGTCVSVFTFADTVMQFFGTFAGTTVTAVVSQCSQGTPPVPTGFTWALNATDTQVVANWNVPPPSAIATELWTSTDGINFTLATVVTSPGTTASVAYAGGTAYARIRFQGASKLGPFTATLSTSVGSDWANRVVANGGARPSQASITASDVFYKALITAGIDQNPYAVNMLAPDSLIAAITPLIKRAGSNDPWTNNGPFVGGDLTVNGLKGDGVAKFLDSGVNPSTAFAAAFDLSFVMYYYDPQSAATVTYDMGAGANPFGNGHFTSKMDTELGALPYSAGSGQVAYNLPANWNGYIALSRTASNLISVYIANSTTAHNLSASSNTNLVTDDRASVPFTVWVHALNFANVINSPSVLRYSFWWIGRGLTSAQSQALFNAIQALRTSFGGGFR